MKKLVSMALIALTFICNQINAQDMKEVNRLSATDPELVDIFQNFAFGETQQYGSLSARLRSLVTLASAVATGSRQVFRMMAEDALASGVTPLEIREVVYHAVPYTGMGLAWDMLDVANEVLSANGVELPLESRAVVTRDNRLPLGRALQEDIFGKQHIANMYDSTPANQLHIQEYLSANCFGDYQTRSIFDARTRELLTFSILVSLGGCEPQVKGHIQGNLNVGNDKATLLAAVTQLLPYIGYPRTLNAIACLNEVVPEK